MFVLKSSNDLLLNQGNFIRFLLLKNLLFLNKLKIYFLILQLNQS